MSLGALERILVILCSSLAIFATFLMEVRQITTKTQQVSKINNLRKTKIFLMSALQCALLRDCLRKFQGCFTKLFRDVAEKDEEKTAPYESYLKVIASTNLRS